MRRTTFEEFEDLLNEHRVIPVVREIPRGEHTPVGIFELLCLDTPGSFLLESAEAGVWSRYSFIGVNTLGILVKESDQPATWTGQKPPLPTGEDLHESALGALEQMVSAWSSSRIPNLPPLTNGLVGVLGWDVIREIEKLPNPPKRDFSTPDLFFSMFSDLVVVDHLEEKLLLVSNVFVHDVTESTSIELFSLAKASLDTLQAALERDSSKDTEPTPSVTALKFDSNQSPEQFLSSVQRAKEYVRIGDVFQVVLSQRFDKQTEASALEIYRALRVLNPSPYMYLVNGLDSRGTFNIVGSSPEALVTVTAGRATMHPIAGSRPRGTTVELDEQLASELTNDAKERAEHLMLVDLARNDLLKVCESQSVTVTEFMQIHKFSHIMHLVSTVEGEVRSDQDAVDVFKATFPAGTLSGAPKPRALEIIDELEPSNRGLYGGVVGYFDFSGDADLAISIRTATVRDGVAHVQAGAGLVLDSVPELEFAETQAKASAVLRAIATAEEHDV